MKILLIAFYFAPLNKIAAIRPSKLCKYWVRSGHDVTVLTADNERAFPLHDRLLLSTELEQCSIVRTPFLSRTLLKKSVRSADGEPARQGGSPAAEVKPQAVSLLRRTLEWTRTFFNEENSSWYWMSRGALRRLMRNEKFDMVVSTFGPINCHRLGMYAKKLQPSVQWIADFRDPYYMTDDFKLGPVRKALIKRRETNVYQKADCITFISEGITEFARSLSLNKPVEIITNGFDLDDNRQAGAVTERKGKLTVAYAGSIYAHMRDATALFEAIRDLIEAGSIAADDITVEYAGYHGAILKSFAEKCNLQAIVTDHGMLPREKALALLSGADATLLLTTNRRNRQGVTTGKFYDYLLVGRPIIALVGGDIPNSEVAQMIRENGLGFVWEEAGGPQETERLKEYLLARLAGRQAGEGNLAGEFRESFAYGTLAERFIELGRKGKNPLLS